MCCVIQGLQATKKRIINVEGGNVLHGLTKTDLGFAGFGELYFSEVLPGSIKAWKRHTKMTMNLLVPVGLVTFVFLDGREGSVSQGNKMEITVGLENYVRLTVPPMIWFGFCNPAAEMALVTNFANITHQNEEVERKPIDFISHNWDGAQ